MTVFSPSSTQRVMSVTHADHHAAGDLVQDAVANAQLEGWVIQSVVRTPDLESHTYEITTARPTLLSLSPAPLAA